MISIEEAIQIVKKTTKPLLGETIKPIEKSGGYKLFKNVYSDIDMPPFRQAAMDGYALHLHDGLTYNLIGEIKAGDNFQPYIKKGEAVRIFTGAAVPDTAHAVIMQEKVKNIGNQINIEHNILENHNIRPVGEQVKKGDLALKKDTKLTPAAIGYLSSLGISEISVYKKPSIAIVTTGNELIEAKNKLGYGQIYESNSKMLQSALYNLKFYDVTIHKIKDNYNQTVTKLNDLIINKDLVIITGGISVGDYDFVGKALNQLEVYEHFYKVKQKPGKPLYYGKKENTLIFALPGNPAAALTCFYIYVYIALQNMMNNYNIELPRIQAISLSNFEKKGDRPQFLKAIYKNGSVTILEGQSSAMQQTFAISNALVFVPDSKSRIKKNDPVETIILPL
ncbi:molybdenum cofactor biosynthesis protein [Pseudalgibacter alginicilyticus]|uniref:Molybdopterin molybdenumtransferase n=1 Tax=Pseudalgibacter alginicilyticus TaxID=1736674 RepID=A0A0P0CIX3_9FLAO|nr:molybdopterin molybdotransferase MoeA [Pseudalgibacter alginicilyticus]ALJ04308.1 molybdenum cofactor biosynthesis protein [Pseudalgibacter alginicilyticus]